jgi:hypothetical protein
MTLPALLLGFILSSLYGALFHLWRGGGAGRLLLDLILAWMGFWIGERLATWIGLEVLKVGQLNVAAASLMAFVFLFIGHWLSLTPNRTT